MIEYDAEKTQKCCRADGWVGWGKQQHLSWALWAQQHQRCLGLCLALCAASVALVSLFASQIHVQAWRDRWGGASSRAVAAAHAPGRDLTLLCLVQHRGVIRFHTPAHVFELAEQRKALMPKSQLFQNMSVRP